jgi:hypothetical protein
VLDQAEDYYYKLLAEGNWIVNGAEAKLNETAFTASTSNSSSSKVLNCWNCGLSGHNLTACPSPKNPAVIEANCSKFFAAKRSTSDRGRGGSNNAALYAPPEPGASNHHVINGVKMYFHFNTRTWKPDDRSPQATPASIPIPAPPFTIIANAAVDTSVMTLATLLSKQHASLLAANVSRHVESMLSQYYE